MGNAVVVPAAITVSDGNGGNNYSVTYINYTAGTINPKALTVSGLTALGKVYDGTNDATLSGTAAFLSHGEPARERAATANLLTWTRLSPGNYATGTFANPYVGTNKPVTSYVTVTGTGSGNYTATQPSLTANITNLVVGVDRQQELRRHGSHSGRQT